MENQGYLIVLKQDICFTRFESNSYKNRPKGWGDYWDGHRKAFRDFDPKKYRGISREPLKSYFSLDEENFEYLRRNGVDVDSNKEARIQLTNIVPETTIDYCYNSFIANCDDVVEIYKMLDNPTDWEIIHIRQNQFEKNSNTLGFDIGYWGGDHFSLIADTIVTPTWHPAPPQNFVEIAGRLSVLNNNLLFDEPSQASQFKEYYISKEWAETEDTITKFCIIQVDSVGINQNGISSF
ncbi:MAG: hypothetical protein ACYSR9_00880 [Planctomycetota bacterium]|jgi:hypothetical protein